jgi:hypothetical protein
LRKLILPNKTWRQHLSVVELGCMYWICFFVKLFHSRRRRCLRRSLPNFVLKRHRPCCVVNWPFVVARVHRRHSGRRNVVSDRGLGPLFAVCGEATPTSHRRRQPWGLSSLEAGPIVGHSATPEHRRFVGTPSVAAVTSGWCWRRSLQSRCHNLTIGFTENKISFLWVLEAL